MARVTRPLFGDTAHGTLDKLMTFRRNGSTTHAYGYNGSKHKGNATTRAIAKLMSQASAEWGQLPRATRPTWAAYWKAYLNTNRCHYEAFKVTIPFASHT
ncbi:hypothetical protein CCP4SC76_6750003 [Gammaproteobacteria bacterium]